jgi:2-oxoisovalerate dehydrogenase E1 component
MIEAKKAKSTIDISLLKEAYKLMSTAKRMAEKYDEEKEFCSTYVHSTSRGHEAIQLAAGMQLRSTDFAALYYRDESILLGLGMQPNELMMQMMAKKNDPFTGGRSYYGHPALKREGFPTIPHQSSATGMQAIPATGMAHAISYLESQDIPKDGEPIVLCSLGDGCVTEGEVAEAFQMAALHQLPIVYLVQDNDWGISATGKEMRSMDAYEYAAGFKGLKRMRVNGTDFVDSYKGLEKAYSFVRKERKPILVHANCALLGHHTSGVRKEWYRSEEDLQKHSLLDPVPILEQSLIKSGATKNEIKSIQKDAYDFVEAEFKTSKESDDPDITEFDSHEFAPTLITQEKGNRTPQGGEKEVMVDAALHAIDDILRKHPEALLYGQDVGGTLGGVFREAATLTQKYGKERVFNTPIQEAYIVGSTAGMSAVGVKPIVEIQFADYMWAGINQLVEELSKSCYLSKGKFPIQSLIRIPIGAYGGGGPYHSGSVESTLLNIRGIKVIYPSNAADMKGLIKAAFYDPNPVISLEHKGLYWSKVPGTDAAKMVDPDENYIIPLGKAAITLEANQDMVENGETIGIVTYGMGVHWALNAEKNHNGKVEILDLRTLNPIDWDAIIELTKKHNKIIVLTEEPTLNSFAESLAGRISQECFTFLDAPVKVLGSANLPAVPLNKALEAQMLPNVEKVSDGIRELLGY